MSRKKQATAGQIIRRIRSREMSPIYSLFGGDPFLEDFIINELKTSFLDGSGHKQHFSLDIDTPELLFRELSSFSLFEERRLIVVREIKKLRTDRGRKELIEYIKSPNADIILVIISEEYDLKNTFLKQITTLSTFVDCRTPFEEEMKNWVRFILKGKHIKFTESVLEEYFQRYGDSISHVINEMEKIALTLGREKEINIENIKYLSGHDRTYYLWNLQDSLGKKDLGSCLLIIDSLIQNGTKITGIIVNILFLFQQMLWKKMGRKYPSGFTGINKIITSRLNKYDKSYTYAELIELLQELRKLDMLSKSTTLNVSSLLHPLMFKICKGEYV